MLRLRAFIRVFEVPLDLDLSLDTVILLVRPYREDPDRMAEPALQGLGWILPSIPSPGRLAHFGGLRLKDVDATGKIVGRLLSTLPGDAAVFASVGDGDLQGNGNVAELHLGPLESRRGAWPRGVRPLP